MAKLSDPEVRYLMRRARTTLTVVANGDTFVQQLMHQSVVNRVLKVMQGNTWFVDDHWSLNELHVRKMVRETAGHLSSHETSPMLDVGFFGGYISYLSRRSRCRGTGADIHDLTERYWLFDAYGTGYVSAIFNSLSPFQVPGFGPECHAICHVD